LEECLSEKNKDLRLISKIIEAKDILTAKHLGITAEIVEGPGRILWEFIEKFWETYQQLPSANTCNQMLAEAKMALPQVDEPMEYLVQEILDRNSFERLKQLQTDLETWMRDKPPDDIDAELQSYLDKKRNNIIRKLDISEEKAEWIEKKIEASQKGMLGIPTPFPLMDEMTDGWIAGDLSLFVARPGGGKTWLTILAADMAAGELRKLNPDGKPRSSDVLYISCEMTKEDIVMRHAALEYKINYRNLRKGKLDDLEKYKFEQAKKEFELGNRFKVVDASGGVNTSMIESMIAVTKPKFVVLDALYRAKSVGKPRDRNENVALVTTELKSVASRQHVPIVASTQLNRKSTEKKSIGTEDMAMSDALGWEATNVFALYQSLELKRQNQLGLSPVKIREGENSGKDIIMWWDFRVMNFKEVGAFEMMAPIAPMMMNF
jgi:replicative DNA helicase